ncbi:hypothetical protein [Lentzea sp. NEAU-D7]|uniref:hypothetical protein n=1 Tax=Lentzea sp. NEAU-D7 TaxID=2994667 RepID=UPI00224B1951|nr:hypothetical protein [Lentzea sp. NEAU-D7]MCX2955426.1 hypothetical protein [Lentzea sp. NEAU-D7]
MSKVDDEVLDRILNAPRKTDIIDVLESDDWRSTFKAWLGKTHPSGVAFVDYVRNADATEKKTDEYRKKKAALARQVRNGGDFHQIIGEAKDLVDAQARLTRTTARVKEKGSPALSGSLKGSELAALKARFAKDSANEGIVEQINEMMSNCTTLENYWKGAKRVRSTIETIHSRFSTARGELTVAASNFGKQQTGGSPAEFTESANELNTALKHYFKVLRYIAESLQNCAEQCKEGLQEVTQEKLREGFATYYETAGKVLLGMKLCLRVCSAVCSGVGIGFPPLSAASSALSLALPVVERVFTYCVTLADSKNLDTVVANLNKKLEFNTAAKVVERIEPGLGKTEVGHASAEAGLAGVKIADMAKEFAEKANALKEYTSPAAEGMVGVGVFLSAAGIINDVTAYQNRPDIVDAGLNAIELQELREAVKFVWDYSSEEYCQDTFVVTAIVPEGWYVTIGNVNGFLDRTTRIFSPADRNAAKDATLKAAIKASRSRPVELDSSSTAWRIKWETATNAVELEFEGHAAWQFEVEVASTTEALPDTTATATVSPEGSVVLLELATAELSQ